MTTTSTTTVAPGGVEVLSWGLKSSESTRLSLLITASRSATAAAGTAAARGLRAAASPSSRAAERASAQAVVLRAAPRTNDAASEVRRDRAFFGALTGQRVSHGTVPFVALVGQQ